MADVEPTIQTAPIQLAPDRAAPGADAVMAQPVHRDADQPEVQPTTGTALCLSGGGYRAMVFHLGVLWRLNEAGRLAGLDRISSVSGGSITAAVLGLNWARLNFDAGGVAASFVDRVVTPVRAMAGTDVDVPAVLTGLALPGATISERVQKLYAEHLFGSASLQDLPERPQFVINATNLESGALLRFSRADLRDDLVGRIEHPDLPLAQAVTASSAFPPFLSPCVVDLSDQTWSSEDGNTLNRPEYRGRISLSDGGVYDNLGLEAAWNQCANILVSDAGQIMGPDPRPPVDWPAHMLRVLDVVDNQVRSLRKRQVIDAFRAATRDGMYIGIRSDLADYPLPDPIPADPAVTAGLAAVPTRLWAMPEVAQELLINWGYAVCDTGLRAHVAPGTPRGTLPYPDRPLS